ncbi:MAG: galactosylceramidase [Bacteroidaceae bacterium]|nr:galactosylceramidase [Bacteroidaceae bacterium]
MKIVIYISALLLCLSVGEARAQKTIHISSLSTGKTFDGIGIVDGGGATSVLLKDYPEKQRGEILDMLYKPKFGGSVSTLLVEIPGDGNSTQGSMPSHSHYGGDYNFQRGYTWWVLQEAKRRNSQLSLDATGWSAPAWVGNFWSQDMADYYVSWLQGLRSVYGIEMDAIGCHNEKGYSYDFAKALRRTMNERGFKDVKLHGFDNWGDHKMDFLKDMQNDPELRDAFYAVSAHTFSEIQLTPEQRKMAEDMGKPIWNSEDHNYLPGFDALITIVKCFNENYIVSGATKVINWYGIAGVYPMEPYSCDPAMVLAREPWSGHYQVREALWGYAHYGQFTEVGWRYVDDGCGNLPKGGTVATLRNPKTGDFSMIFETKGATERQTVKVKVGKGLSKGKLCVWRSTKDEQFVQQPDLKGGLFTITLEPNAVYSISTTTGQQHGAYADIPASKPFPIPYSDDFEQYEKPVEWGYLPHYLADLIGAFEIVDAPAPTLNSQLSTLNSSKCIRQTVSEHTLSWAPEWHHYTILGDSAWTDYEVSADVYLNPQDEAAVMGRLCDVGSGYGIWAKGYYLKLDDHGKVTLILTRGKRDQKELIGDKEQQEAILARKDVEIGGEYTLSEAKVGGITSLQWHNLKLRFEGDDITGYVDGKEVVKTTSDHYRTGMAGLMAPLQEKRVCTPYFDNLKITPIGRTKAVKNLRMNVEPLYTN